MIPLIDNNINESFLCYKSIEEVIRRKYPSILLICMKCIHNLYMREKEKSAPNVMFLKNLSGQAQRLVTFGGLIKLPGNL